MALYFYEKYNIDTWYSYDNSHLSSGPYGPFDVGNGWDLYASLDSLDIDYYDGYEYDTAPRWTSFGFLNTSSQSRWKIDNAYTMTMYSVWGDGVSTVYMMYWIFELDRTPHQSKGSYITTITAEDGTYPDNGIDGSYWYVKTTLAYPTMYVKVGGTWQQLSGLYVKVSGVWQSVSTAYIKIAGSWQQTD